MSEVEFKIAHISHLSSFSFTHLTFNNLVKHKCIFIQKADKGNKIVTLNSSDYIRGYSTSKFKRENIEGGKPLNYLIQMEKGIICLPSKLKRSR